MKKFFAFIFLLFWGVNAPAHATTVLFENTCPQVKDAAYYNGLENIRNAARSGQKIHAYMRVGNLEFYTELPVMELAPEFVSALLPMRPYINGNAQVSRADGIVGGSLDTLGHYRYAPWLYGGGLPYSVDDQSTCYIIRWFGRN